MEGYMVDLIIRKATVEDATDIIDDLEFEIELVRSVEVNIDYILMLVAKYHDENMEDKEIVVKVEKAIDSSPTLRNKKDLILKFIDTINVNKDLVDEWKSYIDKAKEIELNKIIDDENLKLEETKRYMNQAFNTGELKSVGTDLTDILPAISMFDKNTNREVKKQTVFQKLLEFFERFFG
ncbi:MAG: type I restriction endonuclease subunit R, partial [Gottschalkiaceae bacterium]